jgi:hypothetical protein
VTGKAGRLSASPAIDLKPHSDTAPVLTTTTMSPIPSSLVGYRVSYEDIEQYRALKKLPEHNDRLLIQDLESQIGIPLALVRIDDQGDDGAASFYYLCCFADYSSRPYRCEDLLAIPVPPPFDQLPKLIPVEGDLQRLFAPKTMIFSSGQLGQSGVIGQALPIGGGHV